MFPKPVNAVNIKFNNIKIDTLILKDTASSFIGHTAIFGDKIYFADEYFARLYVFDTNGDLITMRLGQGNSKKEYAGSGISGFFFLPNGQSIYMGASIDCSVYDTHFEKIKYFQIQRFLNDYWKDKEFADNPKNYGLDYTKFTMRAYDTYMYMNVFCAGKGVGFSSIENPLAYYEKAKVLLKVNLETGCVEELVGAYPPSYLKDSDKRGDLTDIGYDIDSKGNFYISYAADPGIYVYDKNFTPIRAFGTKGNNMDTDYLNSYTLKQNEDSYEQWYKGRYTYLKYTEETDVSCRSYTKGGNPITEALQIYQGDTLVADIDVPSFFPVNFFKIAGYIAPYYYSAVYPDAENKTLKIYRFKLE